MKKNKRRKKLSPIPKPTTWYFTFLRLVFELFDVHLPLIYKKRPEQYMGQGKASSLTTY